MKRRDPERMKRLTSLIVPLLGANSDPVHMKRVLEAGPAGVTAAHRSQKTNTFSWLMPTARTFDPSKRSSRELPLQGLPRSKPERTVRKRQVPAGKTLNSLSEERR
jgi:hypothetical protein